MLLGKMLSPDDVSVVRNELLRECEQKLMIATASFGAQLESLRAQLATVTAAAKNSKSCESLAMKRSFQSLPMYSGKPDEYDDWKFKVQTFLSEEDGYAEVLIALEGLLQPPTLDDVDKIFKKFAEQNIKSVDRDEMNKQLYNMLCLNLKDKALAGIKNLFDQREINGFLGWWKLSFECNAMTAQRMQGLANKVFAPRRCKKYGEVTQALEEWEYVVKSYEQAQGPDNKLSGQTRVFSLRQLVPPELERDIIRSTNLDSYEKVKAYIIEQVAIRRDFKNTNSDGPVPMDVDMVMKKVLASFEEAGPQEQGGGCELHEGEHHDHGVSTCGTHEDPSEMTKEEFVVNHVLSVLKGHKGKGKSKGKSGKFDGNCSHCGVYGHRMSQCWKKDQEMEQWRKGKGKGDHQKGSYVGKGYQGGYGGKAWQPGKGKGKNTHGLNLWDLQFPSHGAAHSGGENVWNQPKQPWMLSTERGPTTKSLPTGLCNQWEILREEDVRDEGDAENIEDELDEEDYPWMKVDAKNTKRNVHMPKMGNYSKSRIRQSFNIFMKAPVRPTPLNPVVGISDVDGWTRIRGVMDSGASESVAEECVQHIP